MKFGKERTLDLDGALISSAALAAVAPDAIPAPSVLSAIASAAALMSMLVLQRLFVGWHRELIVPLIKAKRIGVSMSPALM